MNNLLKYNIICLGLFSFLTSTAQHPIHSFSQLRHAFITQTPDTLFDSKYQRWKRTEAYWLKHVSHDGRFTPFEEACQHYYKHFNDTETQPTNNLSAALTSTPAPPPPQTLKFTNWQELGPKSIDGNTHNMGRLDHVEVDPDDPSGNTLYAMGIAGIFRSQDGGKTWRNFLTDTQFPMLCFTDIKLAKDPRTKKKYLYTAVGGSMLAYIEQAWGHEYGIPFCGLFRIEIGTSQWQNLSGNLTDEKLLGQRITSCVYKILIDPNNLNRVFLATSHGVFYSVQAAAKTARSTQWTWKQSAYTQPALGIDFDYSDPTRNSLYCSFQQLLHTKNIYTQAFDTLSSNKPNQKGFFNNYSILPTGAQALAATQAILTATSHVNIATSPAHPQKVFISLTTVGEFKNGETLSSANNTSLFEYTKQGAAFPNNFKPLDQHPGIGNHLDKNFIRVSPFSPHLICYNYAFAAWGGGGGPRSALYDLKTNQVSYTILGMHDDLHDLCFGPNGRVYITSDGGLFSASVKAPFEVRNHNGKGLNNTKFYGGSVWEKDGKKAMGGFHDNFTYETENIYQNEGWRFVTFTGDGDRALYLPNGDVYFNSCYNSYPIYWRKHNEKTFSYLTMPCKMSSVWQKVYKSPSGNADLYLTGEELYMAKAPYTATNMPCASPFQAISDYRNENAGEASNTTCGQSFMSDFDISPDEKTIYALFFNNAGIWSEGCQKNSGIYVPVIKTSLGGKNNPNQKNPCTGTACWSNLPDMNTLQLKGNASCVAMNPNNPDQVWIGSSGYSFPSQPNFTRRMVFSNNGGKSFIDFSEGLPDVPVNRIVARKGTSYEVYAATDVGIYYRTNTTKQWIRVGLNFPRVITYDLQLDLCNQKIYAYTFGRGMWSIDLPKSNGETMIPGIKIGSTTTYTGSISALNGWVVPQGVTLSLKNATVSMGPYATITVEPGGVLEVEESTLQCYCDNNTWKGIIYTGSPQQKNKAIRIQNTRILGVETNEQQAAKKTRPLVDIK